MFGFFSLLLVLIRRYGGGRPDDACRVGVWLEDRAWESPSYASVLDRDVVRIGQDELFRF